MRGAYTEMNILVLITIINTVESKKFGFVCIFQVNICGTKNRYTSEKQIIDVLMSYTHQKSYVRIEPEQKPQHYSHLLARKVQAP